MGSSISKSTKSAATSAKALRRYPTRIPPTTTTTTTSTSAKPAPAPPQHPGPGLGPTTTIHANSKKPPLHANANASSRFKKDEGIIRDGLDPTAPDNKDKDPSSLPSSTFSSRLSTLNPVTPPSPFPSPPSSLSPHNPNSTPPNPSLQLLKARNHLSNLAEAEFSKIGKKGMDQGREFLDAATIRRVLELCEKGGEGEVKEVERRMGLRGGFVGEVRGGGVFGVV